MLTLVIAEIAIDGQSNMITGGDAKRKREQTLPGDLLGQGFMNDAALYFRFQKGWLNLHCGLNRVATKFNAVLWISNLVHIVLNHFDRIFYDVHMMNTLSTHEKCIVMCHVKFTMKRMSKKKTLGSYLRHIHEERKISHRACTHRTSV